MHYALAHTHSDRVEVFGIRHKQPLGCRVLLNLDVSRHLLPPVVVDTPTLTHPHTYTHTQHNIPECDCEAAVSLVALTYEEDPVSQVVEALLRGQAGHPPHIPGLVPQALTIGASWPANEDAKGEGHGGVGGVGACEWE